MEDLNINLHPTEFLDFDEKQVSKKAFEIIKGLNSEKEKAIALFYWVRDNIKYNMYTYDPRNESNLKASVTLDRGNGFCMAKAILLSTFARAVGIPARIHMVDIVNHKIPKWLEDSMGTRTFHCHGYSELYIEGKWRKLTPVFDKDTAIKAGYEPLVEYDGENDALLAQYDKEGNLFVEYVEDYGIYTDVPVEEIRNIFEKNYGKYRDKKSFQKLEKMKKQK